MRGRSIGKREEMEGDKGGHKYTKGRRRRAESTRQESQKGEGGGLICGEDHIP